MNTADTGVDRTVFAIQDISPPIPDSGFMNIRFINAMAKTEALSLIRVDSASPTVVVRDTVASNIAFKQASNFIKVRIASTNAFLRYRMVITSTGMPVGGTLTPGTSVSLNYRSGTIYGSGFGNGTTTWAPFISGIHLNK